MGIHARVHGSVRLDSRKVDPFERLDLDEIPGDEIPMEIIEDIIEGILVPIWDEMMARGEWLAYLNRRSGWIVN